MSVDDVSQVDDIIAKANVGVQQSSIKTRVNAILNIRQFLINDLNNETKPGQLKKIIRIVVSSLLDKYYLEELWRVELYSLLRELSEKISLDFHQFVVNEYLQSESIKAKLFNSVAVIRCSLIDLCVFLVGLTKTNAESTPSLISTLLRVTGEQIENISTNDKLYGKACHLANRLLSTYPRVISSAVEVWGSEPFLSASATLLTFLQKQPQSSIVTESLTRLRSLLLDVYRKRLSTAKQSAGLVTPAWKSLLTDIVTADVWKNDSSAENSSPAVESLQSAALKAMKKAPEGSSHSIALLVDSLGPSIDLNSFVLEGGAVLVVVRMLKSADEAVRASGIALIKGIAARCSDSAAYRTLTAQLIEFLAGKGLGGVLTQTYQKTSIWLAVQYCGETCSSVLGRHIAAETASVVAAEVAALLEKESDANTRLMAASALGRWLAHCLPASCDLARLLGGAKTSLEKVGHSAASGYLLALSVATQSNEDVLAACESLLTPALVGLVKEATKKGAAIVSTDAVLAVALLARLTTLSSAMVEVFESGKLWPVVHSGASSFLYSKQLVQHLNAIPVVPPAQPVIPVGAALASDLALIDSLGMVAYQRQVAGAISAVLASVSRNHPQHVLSALQSSEALSAVHASLLHNDRAVRQAAVLNVKVIVRHAPETSQRLVQGLWSLLQTTGQQREQYSADLAADFKYASSLGGNEETGAKGPANKYKQPSVPASGSLASAIGACVPQSCEGAVQTTATPLALLVASHPFVSGSASRASSLWASLNLAVTPHDVLGVAEAIEAASVSETAVTRAASSAALCTLTNGSASTEAVEVAKIVLDKVGSKLRSSNLSSLSPEEELIYLDPEAALASAVASNSSASGSVADVEVTNADRKKTAPRSSRRGQFGADAVEDEDWVERVRKEKADKLAASRSSAEGDLRSRLSRDIAAAREVIKGRVDEVKYSLELWAAFARIRDPALARSSICQIVGAGTAETLLRSAVVSEAAFCALYVLAAHVLEPDLKQYSRDVVDSLRVVLGVEADWTAQDAFRHINKLNGPVLRLLRGAQLHVSRGHPLLPSSVQLLYPVLREVLRLPTVIPGSEVAFFLLDSLWPSADTFSKGSADLLSVRGLLSSVLDTVLLVLVRPVKADPPADKVFVRIAAQSSALSHAEWAVLIGEHGLLSAEAKVRNVCLQAVSQMVAKGLRLNTLHGDVLAVLWAERFDENEAAYALARQLWSGREGDPAMLGLFPHLEPLLRHDSKHVRDMAAKAVAGVVSQLAQAGQHFGDILSSVQQIFVAAAPVRPAVLPAKPSVATSKVILPLAAATKKVAPDVTVGLRTTIAGVFVAVGVQRALPVEDVETVTSLLQFILERGVTDLHADVRAAMLLAGKAVIDSYGKEQCDTVRQTLEVVLARKHASSEDVADYDNRHGAAVVLLGAAGRHLDKDDPAILVITDSMVEALRTPSESVQRSVADCLASLLQVIKTHARALEILEALIHSTLEGSSYGDRRGAAFGLSAVVKGLGIPSLKQHDVVGRLKEACTNGSINARQGSLFAFECLSERLGLLFEPYIIVVVPIMLKSFSHSSDHVRDAAQGAARVIMSKLSAHGVKQVLTPILSSLKEEPAWKSRQEAIRLLGMMAHCAPKQLATCLPQIVVCLVDAGSDPHPKVKESAKSAMTDISSVIRNPEISRLGPVLLSALADPSNRTRDALEALLECEFMHSIDAPSLALLVPILGRALRDRGADSKRKAAAITGNIMTMVSEPAALAPYLPQVLPGLKDCLMDPIPDVRASSAKALGSLFEGVGEEQLSDLVPWLVATLRTDISPVERSGAAQGLSELCGHGMEAARVEQILTQVLRLKNESQSAPKEGLLWFLSFLPMTLNEAFAAYISVCLPVILSGLSDDNDGVRDVAMRAGQVVVSKLGLNHTLKLLPSLADGMFNEDWRIRQSSVKLLGELLYLVGDTKAVGLADGEDEDDEVGGAAGGSISRVSITIRAHIGEKHTNEVLASLYIVRSDIANSVRQVALQIWKSIVNNTPRTLVEIMPVLVLQLIAKLSSDSEDLRQVAGRALGELVRKLGDRVLPVIVPHLRQGLRSAQESMRQGACSGLSEILTACTKKQAEDYLDVLMPALRQALCDQSSEVCEQAAHAFMTLFKTVGVQAIDEVVPALLDTLASGTEEAELALRGLREIVQLRPRDLIEYLLPTLMTSPIQYVSARALGSVCEVAGLQLNYHFHTVIPTLTHELYLTSDKIEKLKARLEICKEGGEDAEEEDQGAVEADLEEETERFHAVKDAASAIMGAVVSSGSHVFFSELGKQIEHETNVKRRRWGCWLAEQYVSRSKAEYSDYVPLLLKYVLSRVAELDTLLLEAVRDCLSAMSTNLPLEELTEHIGFIRNCISSAASAARHKTGTGSLLTASGEFILPLFTLPKSLDPLLNVMLFGLMNGSSNVREAAAETIGEFAQMCDPLVLKPLLIKTTGPLIRVIGDRYPSNVKSAILQALIVLLDKGGASLKAFVPQLQTTFVKSLNDPSREVRLRGGVALGKLMNLSLRMDPLLTELSTICLQADSNAIKASVLEAIVSVLAVSGDKATSASLDKVRAVVVQNIADEDDAIRSVTARCIGSLAALLDASQSTDLLIDLLDIAKDGAGPERIAGRLAGVAALLQTAGQRAVEMREEAFAVVFAGLRDERSSIKATACQAVATLFTTPQFIGWEERKAEYRTSAQAAIHSFATALSGAAQDSSSGEVRVNAITAIKQSAKFYHGASAQHLKEFLPPLLAAVKDINIQVKYIAERALKHLSEGGASASAAPISAGATAAAAAPSSGGHNPIFSAFVGTMDADSGRFVRDYLKRVVARLPSDSDDESNDKW